MSIFAKRREISLGDVLLLDVDVEARCDGAGDVGVLRAGDEQVLRSVE